MKRKVAFTPPAPMPTIAVDATLLTPHRLDNVAGSEQLAHDLHMALRAYGVIANSEQEANIMTAILPLIVKRDDAVFNYAYKAGRASL